MKTNHLTTGITLTLLGLFIGAVGYTVWVFKTLEELV